MTLNQIKYFMALGEYLNYSKASEKLFISQPTLSRSISELENDLGVKLLNRDKNSVTLTEAGAILMEIGDTILNQTYELENRLKSLATGYSGHLKVLCPSLNCRPLFDAFGSFQEAFPNIRFELEAAEMWNIAEKLNDKQCDVGVVFSFAARREEPSLGMISIADDSFCLLASENTPFYDRESVSVEELNSHEMIRYGDSGHKTQMFYDLYCRIGIEEQYGPDSPHIIRTMDTALLELKLFGGAMIVPSVMVPHLPEGIRRIMLKDDFVWYKIIVAWNKINENPAIGLLKKHLESCGFPEIRSSFTKEGGILHG